ncbi:anaerobic sulfatase maturase [Anaerobaca lacustris]|uniref:Anaerobic sulfatase maturase n=1 Tax=Anaerobaca lacustris TaxID=3044600 RepID=A0AAW6U1G7_9BACT|nr:anaerobic sulfatase maturase [Sedimentisphaerales bacterium M17dextr]
MQPFTLLIKPSGSDCNVDCEYCFYKCRAPEIGQGRQRMSDEVLHTLVKDYMELRFPVSGFAWQGGEPTLMGLDFYRKTVEWQVQYGVSGQEVGNSLQTNAILLDSDEWGKFLHEARFLVGISIDGPKELHDRYRLDLGGHGTWDRVMRAIDCCKRHDVEFNTLTLINNLTAEHPDEVFDFLLDLGVRYLQFIPCVEVDPQTGQIAEFSVSPEQYGEFLCRIFDRWLAVGPDKLSIRDFDSLLSYCIGGRHTICTFDRQCSQYIVIEHSGDVFPCDFFVEPQWKLGNIVETPIQELAASAKKRAFARRKQNLNNRCLVCRHLAVCRGGCMKDRAPRGEGVPPLRPVGIVPVREEQGQDALATEDKGRMPSPRDDQGRESYFCESYQRFFDYALPKLMQVAAKIRSGSLVRPQQLT